MSSVDLGTTRRPMPFLLVLVLAAITAMSCAAAQPEPGAEVVRKLVAQAEGERAALALMALDNTATTFERRSAPASTVGRFLHAAKAYSLGVKNSQLQVLKALPKSAVEMEALYEFVHQPASSKELVALYRGLYQAAFQSVIKNPDYLHAVFGFSTQFDTKLWTNYDDIDWFCSQLGTVYRAIPSLYDSASKLENRADRAFISRCASD